MNRMLSLVLIIFLIGVMFVSATPVPDTCTDNDSANNIYFKGTVILNDANYVDQCDGASANLKQYNCKELPSHGQYQAEVSNTQCAYGCQNGVCLPADGNNVPEFSTAAAGISLAGAAAGFIFLRKKK